MSGVHVVSGTWTCLNNINYSRNNLSWTNYLYQNWTSSRHFLSLLSLPVPVVVALLVDESLRLSVLGSSVDYQNGSVVGD